MAFLPTSTADFLTNESFVQWVMAPTPASEQTWQAWLREHPDKREMLQEARVLLGAIRLKDTHRIPEARSRQILEHIQRYQQHEKQHPTRSAPLHTERQAAERRRSRVRPLRHVASALVAACLLLGGFFLARPYLNTLLTEEAAAPVAYITQEVRPGQKMTLQLADGTTIRLNASSTLRYPEQFSDTLRKVYLTGQAFFQVAHNAQAPFIVETPHFSTRVLGTSFDINAYPDQPHQHVALVTGKVEVATQTGATALLNPSEMSSYDESSGDLTTSTFDVETMTGWKDGLLIFDHTPFEEVLPTLANWYGVEFVLEDGFRLRGTYSGRFTHESLENVLVGMSYSASFQYRIAQQKVYLSAARE
ncbi:ferric-dicitrate binding protein FerR, regulates iron transport through sigma-19 [Catalinimonas alkaloidigena]|uniref:Ferric-dicitrate binding protein FerR, regulates iron transport through sigma-19 n=1 Tax=Catalinimonas alkaloidigena TaxID=1075417 RepID=A0A1G9S8U5_9BACT|nr:FecR domain-containing protein [Catalinimonas alkaloidigena]SDM31215.1 ferric-dicitrate binding protein FerR, regulates iron transport through sigma-19 [Catalinimonas alkaloidigena]